MQQTSERAENLHERVGRVFDEAVRGGSELATSQMKDWETTREAAGQVQASLERIGGQEIQDLLSAFGSMREELVGRHPHLIPESPQLMG